MIHDGTDKSVIDYPCTVSRLVRQDFKKESVQYRPKPDVQGNLCQPLLLGGLRTSGRSLPVFLQTSQKILNPSSYLIRPPKVPTTHQSHLTDGFWHRLPHRISGRPSDGSKSARTLPYNVSRKPLLQVRVELIRRTTMNQRMVFSLC